MILRDSELINEVPISCLRGCEKKKKVEIYRLVCFPNIYPWAYFQGRLYSNQKKSSKRSELISYFFDFYFDNLFLFIGNCCTYLSCLFIIFLICFLGFVLVHKSSENLSIGLPRKLSIRFSRISPKSFSWNL